MVKLILRPPKLHCRSTPEFPWNEMDWTLPATRREANDFDGCWSPRSRAPREMDHGQLIEENGNILDTPPESLILHACNCRGLWDAGVAKAIKEKFPAAYAIYRKHCTRREDSWLGLLGTTLLIPPQEADEKLGGSHWIGCVFTKIAPGAPRGSFGQVDIYDATTMALKDLTKQVEALGMSSFPGGIYCPLLNSGIFSVPWSVTRHQLCKTGLPITALVWSGMSQKSTFGLDDAGRDFMATVDAQRNNRVTRIPHQSFRRKLSAPSAKNLKKPQAQPHPTEVSRTANKKNPADQDAITRRRHKFLARLRLRSKSTSDSSR